MPIRPELRPLYRTPEYLAARSAVMRRARNRCEQCGKPNHESVETCTGHTLMLLGNPGLKVMAWRAVGGSWMTMFGKPMRGHPRRRALTSVGPARTIRVVLTCAHLDHDPRNNDLDNLKFLCQWCHLNHDLEHHHETRAIRKDSARGIRWEGGIAV